MVRSGGPKEAKSVAEYQPLSLRGAANAGLDALPGESIVLGLQLMRGIPFEVPDDPSRCFVLLRQDDDQGIARLQVESAATWVIFAHRILTTNLMSGGPIGEVVAKYKFRLEDGSEEVVPIRDRFEIAISPKTSEEWGQLPLLALPSRFDSLPPRYFGEFARSGYRMTDIDQLPIAFYLWAWKNPNPALRLSAIELASQTDGRVLIAGIALSTLMENPLRLPPARPVAVQVLTEAADGDGEVGLQIDRGVANYAYPLPSMPVEELLSDPLKGWGEPLVTHGASFYANAAGLPSAKLEVRQGDQPLGSAAWSELDRSGSVTNGSVRIEMVETGRNWVRTVVLDDETSRPIACRVHFRSTAGVPYQPHGHHQHVNSDLHGRNPLTGAAVSAWDIDVGGDLRLGRITYAYIDGTCEGWLPRGEVIVDLARGFEYEPIRTRVHIEDDQRELTFRLKRHSNVRADGWFSGDTHVHFLSVDGSHLEAQAEDLQVVNLLATQWGSLFTNTEDLTGVSSTSVRGDTVVHVSQENRQHLLGHISLLGLKKVVMPWCSDGSPEAELGGALETGLAHWADRCHEQGGLVVLPHFPNPNGEPAALVASGRVDAVEFVDHMAYSHHEYYRYLNCGYKLPLVGGTDKMSNDVPVGLMRTFARIEEEDGFSYESWCRAVAEGRTFASSGPILKFTVDGADIGDVLNVKKGAVLEIEASAHSIFPIHSLEIVQQGKVIAASNDSRGTSTLKLRERVNIDRTSWFAARVAGPEYTVAVRHLDEWVRGVMAHTSPIYVTCEGSPRLWDETSGQHFLDLIEGGLKYVSDLSPLWPDLQVMHHHGERDHRAYLQRPFLEAREALLKRQKGD